MYQKYLDCLFSYAGLFAYSFLSILEKNNYSASCRQMAKCHLRSFMIGFTQHLQLSCAGGNMLENTAALFDSSTGEREMGGGSGCLSSDSVCTQFMACYWTDDQHIQCYLEIFLLLVLGLICLSLGGIW